MKHTGTCPKCGGTDILVIPGYTGDLGGGNSIALVTSFHYNVPVYRYLCCNCTFSEEWIDESDIPLLKENFGTPKKE